MTESPVVFGPAASLMGVLTQPEGAPATATAFLLFNAGVLPRIGPHRLNVKLARALALAGQTCLRFDLAGQGDSHAAPAGLEFKAQAVHDIGCAMDWLEHHCGIRRFALIGICTGAVSVFATARVDPRVAAILMFDGHWHRTRWTLPVRHWKRFRVLSWRAVAGSARRHVARLLQSRASPPSQEYRPAEEAAVNPPRAEFVSAMQALVDRRMAVYLVYSVAAMDYYSYASQFRHAFGEERFFDKVRCDFRPDIDHSFVSLEAQRRTIGLVIGWIPEVKAACEASA